MLNQTVSVEKVSTDDAPSFKGANTTSEHITNFLKFIVFCYSPVGLAMRSLKKAHKKYASARAEQGLSSDEFRTWAIQRALVFCAYVDEAMTIPESENLSKTLKNRMFGEDYNPNIRVAVRGAIGESKNINAMNRDCAKELTDKKWNSVDTAIESAVKMWGKEEPTRLAKTG